MPTRKPDRPLAALRLLALLMAIFIPLPMPAQTPPDEALHPLPPELDAYVRGVMRDWEIPGLAIAVVHGDSVFVRGYGVRELGRQEPVDENTVFDAASLTKSFTATAIGMLVDEGRMRWDEPVRTYLPNLAFADPYLTANVTMRDLLSHRTGLAAANGSWRLTNIGADEIVRRARFIPVAAPVRTTLIYSNVGYALAGQAAASAAGMPWEALVTTRILQPLGMRASTADFDTVEMIANRAIPHALIGGELRPIRREVGGRDGIAAAGSVQSTAADLARWLRFQLGDGTWRGARLVSDSVMQQLRTPNVLIPTTPAMRAARRVRFFPGYGLGWQVMDFRGHPMVWHSGSGDGSATFMAVLPQDSLAVLVMMNTWAAPGIHGALAARILDTWLGVRPLSDDAHDALGGRPEMIERSRMALHGVMEGMVEGSVPPRPPADYAGVYADSLYGRMIVREEDGRLTLQMGEGGQVADLVHHHGDTFLVRWRDALFGEYFTTQGTFTAPDGGVPSRFGMMVNRETIEGGRVPEGRE
jgi:CubicO group peptidase (beta-lactamase class C family)